MAKKIRFGQEEDNSSIENDTSSSKKKIRFGQTEENDLFEPEKTKTDKKEIYGKLENKIFENKDTGYQVWGISINSERFVLVANTNQEFITGMEFKSVGEWIDYKGKKQFKSELLIEELPKNKDGIRMWMKNNKEHLPNIGMRTFNILVDYFGNNLHIHLGDADELVKSGIVRSKAEAIASAWSGRSKTAEIEILLRNCGIKYEQITKSLEIYNEKLGKIISENPWRLMEIDGIGMESCDKLGQNFDIPLNSPLRIEFGIKWAFKKIIDSTGNVGIPHYLLKRNAAKLLKVNENILIPFIEQMCNEETAYFDEKTKLIFPYHLWTYENELSEKIADLIQKPDLMTRDEAIGYIEMAEKELDMFLDRDGGQFNAALLALTKRFAIITGGPGTGKSTTQKIIVKASNYYFAHKSTKLGIKSTFSSNIALCAPTGRAAKRLQETSEQNGNTIHSMLGYNGKTNQFSYGKDNPIEFKKVICDEFSMSDLKLSYHLFTALKEEASILLVGDIDQLPSVGPGQVLRDLIECGHIPVARLTTIHRQAEDSGISIAAKRINEGVFPIQKDEILKGFEFDDINEQEDILDNLVELIQHRIPSLGYDPMKDVQILVSMKKGTLGTVNLNEIVKKRINPVREDGNSIVINEKNFTMGDKVMQIKNSADGVMNGDLDEIVNVVDAEKKEDRYFEVNYSGNIKKYDLKNIDELIMAYAGTIHKSQGAEFPVVIIVVPDEHKEMMTKNLLYTALTRAKTDAFIIGSKEAIEYAISRTDKMNRYTLLKEKINALLDLDYKPRLRF